MSNKEDTAFDSASNVVVSIRIFRYTNLLGDSIFLPFSRFAGMINDIRCVKGLNRKPRGVVFGTQRDE